MKGHFFYILFLALMIFHLQVQGQQGFSLSAITWGLPAGGQLIGGHSFGFNNTSYSGSSSAGNQAWSSIDMNGDGQTDLVITAEGNGAYLDGFGAGTSSQLWKVYPGEAGGFSKTALSWALPQGGAVTGTHSYGFNSTHDNGSTSLNDQGWSLQDMNGDKLPDLLVFAQGDGSYKDCFGISTSAPWWNVYLNLGNGFSGTAVKWWLPAGGQLFTGHLNGFNNVADNGSNEANDQGWQLSDLDGDTKPDLIVFTQGDGSYNQSFGVGTNPHWKVYLNEGNKFSSSALTWSLPAGGKFTGGYDYGFNSINSIGSANINDLAWQMSDMNGDSKPDLVIVAQGDGTFKNDFSSSTNRYWKVYFNEGTKFSASTHTWVVPAGGQVNNNFNLGYNAYSYAGTFAMNNQGWQVMDLDGDNRPDLVVYAKGNGSSLDCYGAGSANPYWKVYLNTASGFSASSVNWSLPQGGRLISNLNSGYNSIFSLGSNDNGNQGWACMDVNGDKNPDLLVFSEGDGAYRNCFAAGTANQHWRVYVNTSTSNAVFEEISPGWFSVYPNPVEELIIVERPFPANDETGVIYDLSGRPVKQFKLSHSREEVAINGLDAGVYYVFLSKHALPAKLIKQ